jgi:endonuclease-3 related protein
VRQNLLRLYERLRAFYGTPKFWSDEPKWEIMVGAILTQNTAWTNVNKALENLKRANVLDPARIFEMELAELEGYVRSAGFTTSKPKRLKTLAGFLLQDYQGIPENMRGGDPAAQRARLLALNGVGPETADAILLFAAEQPIFVIDAYTRRILARMGTWRAETGIFSESSSYTALQELFMRHLPPDVAVFQRFHALLDIHAKQTCTKRAPRCGECPLTRICLKVGVGAIRA